MALVVDATSNGASANSYCTVAEADTYHESLVQAHITAWTGATTEKSPAVVQATAILDRICEWKGYKATQTQALRHGRTGVPDRDGNLFDNSVQQWLKDATAELARHLITANRENAKSGQGLDAVEVGPLSVDFAKSDTEPTLPDSVRSMVGPYVKGFDDFKSRTSFTIRRG